MADSNYRTYRRADPYERGSAASGRDAANDPLAELARLIGQTDPFADAGRDGRRAAVDHPDTGEAARPHAPADRPFDEPRYPAPDDASYPDDQRYAGQRDMDSLGADGDHRYADEPHDMAPPPGYAEEYEDGTPSRNRRGGLVVVIAVLGLAVVGTAGAFAYRAMFGGTIVPSLPPIIKATDGPNKVVPATASADSKAKASYDRVASLAQDEKVVPREEQPVDMKEPPKAPPRIISTIPVAGGSPTVSPLSVPPPASAAPPAPAAAAPVPPATASAEPKKIRTVVIRPDQPGGIGAAAALPPPTRSVGSRRPAAAPAPSASEPLALVPSGESPPLPSAAALPPPAAAPAPARSRTAARAPTASASGGYAVQVSSQRSEADAHSAFKSLQARFPSQLSGREAIIRRADLGSKGIYFRALVGPFASMEAAAGLCSSLKAAGGNCIVQKN